jgi:membrane protein required for colicin V production
MLLGGAEAVGVGILATMLVVSLAPATRQPIFSSPSGRIMGTVMEQMGPVLPAEVRHVLFRFWHGEAPADAVADASPPAARVPAPDFLSIQKAALESGPTPAPRREPRKDPALRQAGATPSGGELEDALARGRREMEQAAVETLDTAPDQEASSLRQLVERDGQRLKGAVSDTVGSTRQRVGDHVKNRVSQGQRDLEQAITDSIEKGQQRVEQAITDSIDQQLRRLGGLQPAAPRGKK